jgi:hypothetical protein
MGEKSCYRNQREQLFSYSVIQLFSYSVIQLLEETAGNLERVQRINFLIQF